MVTGLLTILTYSSLQIVDSNYHGRSWRYWISHIRQRERRILRTRHGISVLVEMGSWHYLLKCLSAKNEKFVRFLMGTRCIGTRVQVGPRYRCKARSAAGDRQAEVEYVYGKPPRLFCKNWRKLPRRRRPLLGFDRMPTPHGWKDEVIVADTLILMAFWLFLIF
jgi:hypothetical protein